MCNFFICLFYLHIFSFALLVKLNICRCAVLLLRPLHPSQAVDLHPIETSALLHMGPGPGFGHLVFGTPGKQEIWTPAAFRDALSRGKMLHIFSRPQLDTLFGRNLEWYHHGACLPLGGPFSVLRTPNPLGRPETA